MLKANIGWSTEADNFEAGRASAEKAVVDLVQTKVAFLYTSADNDVKKVERCFDNRERKESKSGCIS